MLYYRFNIDNLKFDKICLQEEINLKTFQNSFLICMASFKIKDKSYIIIGFSNSLLETYNLKNKQCKKRLKAYEDEGLNDLVVLNKRILNKKEVQAATCSSKETGNIKIWQLFTGVLLFNLKQQSMVYHLITIKYENHNYLITPGLKDISFWNIENGEMFKVLKGGH